ncbi:carbon-nitrogen hydrolase family protein [candidate division KSB1 bacterium]|nr:carbon-nitrogen hydrolase family protein [candidate division KSB1 bacterium]
MKRIVFMALIMLSIYVIAVAKPTSGLQITSVGDRSVVIANKKQPSEKISFVLNEQTPVRWGDVPLSTREANLDTARLSIMIRDLQAHPNVIVKQFDIPKNRELPHLRWTLFMNSVDDGVDITWLIETFREGLPEFYGVQPGLLLSESQFAGKKQSRVASALRDGQWRAIPAQQQSVAAPTPLGLAVDALMADENVNGLQGAVQISPVDCGLIAKKAANEKNVCAMYWENTSHVIAESSTESLKAIVNIGNIPPFVKRVVRGKIYWVDGTADDVMDHFIGDFKGERLKGKLRVATCQFPISFDIKKNAAWIAKQMRIAKLQNCDIAHFAEGALSGYAKADFDSFAGYNWEQLWAETDSILALAKELKLWLVLGSAHKLSGANKPHNSLYVINPDGEIIDRYDKRFCTTGDLNFYSPGNHFTTFEINNVTCGLLICYDLRFPELYREYVKLNTDVIFHSFNNSRHSIDCIHPKIMPITAQTRAGTNGLYISINNSSAPYGWPSQFITPDGLVNGKLEANKPGILISDVDTSIDFYDASKPYRLDAINGKLNSGETVKDERSENRRIFR